MNKDLPNHPTMSKTAPRLAFSCSCVGGWEWKSCGWVQHQIHNIKEKQKYSKDKLGSAEKILLK
eukprot:9572220-Ditylum_brightwellii.AAC.1